MSHIVTCKVELKNEGCLLKAAEALGLEHLGKKTHEMYGRQKATGHGFRLPDWQYPVVIDEQGTARYDNYNGSWGKQVELDKLVQEYSAQVAEEQALMSGMTVERNVLENGDLELNMTELASC